MATIEAFCLLTVLLATVRCGFVNQNKKLIPLNPIKPTLSKNRINLSSQSEDISYRSNYKSKTTIILFYPQKYIFKHASSISTFFEWHNLLYPKRFK